jgi:ankyrin repeat protein
VEVNAPDSDGNTPLHTKCAGEHKKPIELDAIQVLHEYGAELDKCNNNGETCFHLAAQNGHTEILKLLFELDETKVRESIRLSEEKANQQTMSTLALALRSDHLDTASW